MAYTCIIPNQTLMTNQLVFRGLEDGSLIRKKKCLTSVNAGFIPMKYLLEYEDHMNYSLDSCDKNCNKVLPILVNIHNS